MKVARLLLSLLLTANSDVLAEVPLKEPKGGAEVQVGTKTATGVFRGIEEGDYAHWLMKTDDGEEESYFILQPDASVEKVLENPAKFKGRKCKIRWKESVENIPEAGGKMKIKQVVGVEWL